MPSGTLWHAAVGETSRLLLARVNAPGTQQVQKLVINAYKNVECTDPSTLHSLHASPSMAAWARPIHVPEGPPLTHGHLTTHCHYAALRPPKIQYNYQVSIVSYIGEQIVAPDWS